MTEPGFDPTTPGSNSMFSTFERTNITRHRAVINREARSSCWDERQRDANVDTEAVDVDG